MIGAAWWYRIRIKEEYNEVLWMAENYTNVVDDMEHGIANDHHGATTMNISVYICPSAEQRNPALDLTDEAWDIEGPCKMSRGNYAGCAGAGFYINSTNADGTPAKSLLDGLFGAYDTVPFCDTTIPEGDPMHCIQDQIDGNTYAAARSRHPGGVNVAMVDGSVGFVPSDVDYSVWQALATIANSDTALPPF